MDSNECSSLINEWEWSLIKGFEVSSVNNLIASGNLPIQINSINDFSFREDPMNLNYYNYITFKNEETLEKERLVLNAMGDIKEMSEGVVSPTGKKKICGVFTKDDFDLQWNNNKKLNDSLEEKYHNPLMDELEDDEEGVCGNNNINNGKGVNNKKKNGNENENESDVKETNVPLLIDKIVNDDVIDIKKDECNNNKQFSEGGNGNVEEVVNEIKNPSVFEEDNMSVKDNDVVDNENKNELDDNDVKNDIINNNTPMLTKDNDMFTTVF